MVEVSQNFVAFSEYMNFTEMETQQPYRTGYSAQPESLHYSFNSKGGAKVVTF